MGWKLLQFLVLVVHFICSIQTFDYEIINIRVYLRNNQRESA